MVKIVKREDLCYEADGYGYNFQQYKRIRLFAKKNLNGKLYKRLIRMKVIYYFILQILVNEQTKENRENKLNRDNIEKLNALYECREIKLLNKCFKDC